MELGEEIASHPCAARALITAKGWLERPTGWRQPSIQPRPPTGQPSSGRARTRRRLPSFRTLVRAPEDAPGRPAVTRACFRRCAPGLWAGSSWWGRRTRASTPQLFAPPGQRSAASADCMAFAGVASGLHLAALRPTALPSSLTARHRRCGTGMRALEPLMATTTKASLTVRDSGAPLPVLLTVRRWPRDRKPLPE